MFTVIHRMCTLFNFGYSTIIASRRLSFRVQLKDGRTKLLVQDKFCFINEKTIDDFLESQRKILFFHFFLISVQSRTTRFADIDVKCTTPFRWDSSEEIGFEWVFSFEIFFVSSSFRKDLFQVFCYGRNIVYLRLEPIAFSGSDIFKWTEIEFRNWFTFLSLTHSHRISSWSVEHGLNEIDEFLEQQCCSTKDLSMNGGLCFTFSPNVGSWTVRLSRHSKENECKHISSLLLSDHRFEPLCHFQPLAEQNSN